MPTPMSKFAEIAKRIGNVDPDDEEAVEHFFEEIAPTLPAEQRAAVFSELLDAEGGESRPFSRRHPREPEPDVSLSEVEPVAVPVRPFKPKADGEELDLLVKWLVRWIDEFFRLSGLAVSASADIAAGGRVRVNLSGQAATTLIGADRNLLESMKELANRVAFAQPLLEIVDFVVDRSPTAAASSPRLTVAAESVPLVVDARIPIKTMSVDDAAHALHASSDEFIVFVNAATEQFSVIYKRRDNVLGLIAPPA